ncbi:hypothetical protein [Streptomyces sp. NPDC090022]|uniref:hypothetical protein n=1 Tax=Streptomyces sp. NPDC090022 TaxID=3365920 RepID=UPI0038305281
MKEVQNRLTRLLADAVRADVVPEACPDWLRRPGRTECRAMWETVSVMYGALTGLVLPEQAPRRERRSLDVLLAYEDGQRQILEVDEKQHFTGARALTLEHYPAGTELGFDAARWLARSRALSGREPGGGFARPKPPLFPGDGGRHRQRAFRDALADLLPSQHGWLPTLRVSDTEVTALDSAPDAAASLRALLHGRGVPASHLHGGSSPTDPGRAGRGDAGQAARSLPRTWRRPARSAW